MLHPETFEKLQAVIERGMTPNVFQLPSEPRKMFVSIGGKINEFDVPAALRKHCMASLDDLIAFVENSDLRRPVIFHSTGQVVLLPDDADRRDQVILGLANKPPHQPLAAAARAVAGLDPRRPALAQPRPPRGALV